MDINQDTGTIKNWEKRRDGSLLLWSRIARNGELVYPAGKQVVPTETLYSEDSLNSLVGAVMTLEHPPSFIENGRDRRQYGVGTVLQEIIKESDGGIDYLTAASLIWDEDAIKDIETGKLKEVSAGYYSEKAQQGDSLVQTKRLYNHVALTSAGRAGSEVRLLKDSLISDLVGLHCQYDSLLTGKGIQPKYDWTELEMKRHVIEALSGKVTDTLTLDQCNAVLDFTNNQDTANSLRVATIAPISVPDPTVAERRWIERIEKSYIS